MTTQRWFLHGANSVIIPRGVFYESKMYAQSGDSTANFSNANSPLKNGVVNANDNNLSSNLNSRVIQMVITKNVTLADAWRILDLARTNQTGTVTSFPLFATGEFYTLGFASDVRNLTANTIVVNGGNYSAPPPPPAWWQLFWNTIAGWANAVWNAAVAVGGVLRERGEVACGGVHQRREGADDGGLERLQESGVEAVGRCPGQIHAMGD